MLCYGPIRENRQCSSSKQSLSASGTGAEGKVFIGTTSPSLFAAWRNRLQKGGLEECCSASASIALVTQDIPPTRSRKREPTPSSPARESELAAASSLLSLGIPSLRADLVCGDASRNVNLLTHGPQRRAHADDSGIRSADRTLCFLLLLQSDSLRSLKEAAPCSKWCNCALADRSAPRWAREITKHVSRRKSTAPTDSAEQTRRNKRPPRLCQPCFIQHPQRRSLL